MKKIGNVLLTVFSVGALVSIFAGAIALLGYIVAIIIGEGMATRICLFIYKTYFPWVIRVCSISVACGLIGMYFSRKKAFVVEKENKNN